MNQPERKLTGMGGKNLYKLKCDDKINVLCFIAEIFHKGFRIFRIDAMISGFMNRVFYSGNIGIIRKIFYFLVTGFICFTRKNRYFRNIIQYIYKRFFDYPKLLYIHPQKECNLKCVYCYEKEKKSDLSLNFDDYMRIFREASAMGISSVHILGGEPFLYERLYDMLDLLDRSGFSIYIYTNGSLLDREKISGLKKYRNLSVLFSLEPEQAYEKICKKPFYRKVLENYLECRRQNIGTGVLFTINRLNYPYIRDFFRSTVERFKMNMICERFLPIGIKEIDDMCKINGSQWNTFLSLIKKYNRKNRFVTFSEITPLFRGYGCNDFYESIHIDTDGKVSPCEYVMDRIITDDIKHRSLEQVWENYVLNRKDWLKKAEICKECSFSDICGGGCKAYCFIHEGKFDVKDPLCNGKQIPFA